MFLCLFKHGPQASQLREALYHQEIEAGTKAAEIVIQFVLPLGNRAALTGPDPARV